MDENGSGVDEGGVVVDGSVTDHGHDGGVDQGSSVDQGSRVVDGRVSDDWHDGSVDQGSRVHDRGPDNGGGVDGHHCRVHGDVAGGSDSDGHEGGQDDLRTTKMSVNTWSRLLATRKHYSNKATYTSSLILPLPLFVLIYLVQEVDVSKRIMHHINCHLSSIIYNHQHLKIPT